MIENVGNLVCPGLFDLGEHTKVVIMGRAGLRRQSRTAATVRAW